MNDFLFSKEFKKIRWVLHDLAVAAALVGGSLYAFENTEWKIVITIAGFLYILQQVLKGFEPLHEVYDWSLAYPELKAMSDIDSDIDLDLEEDTRSPEQKKLLVGYLNKQLQLAEEYLSQVEAAKKGH